MLRPFRRRRKRTVHSDGGGSQRIVAACRGLCRMEVPGKTSMRSELRRRCRVSSGTVSKPKPLIQVPTCAQWQACGLQHNIAHHATMELAVLGHRTKPALGEPCRLRARNDACNASGSTNAHAIVHVMRVNCATHRGVRSGEAEALDAGLREQLLESADEDLAVALAPLRRLRRDQRQLRQLWPKCPEHRRQHRLALRRRQRTTATSV